MSRVRIPILAVLGCTALLGSCTPKTPPQAPVAPVAAAPALAELDAYANAALTAWSAPGMAVAVVKDGKLVVARGFGRRERGGQQPVDSHTRFAIASLTKGFTAAAAAMLVGEGKLAWEEPVVARLPGFALKDARVTAELSLRDVLSHRSGLDESADLLWLGTGYDRAEVVARLREVGQAAPLRAAFSYSNVLYSVAGSLIAQAAGQPYEQVVRSRLLEPLAMRDSGFGVPAADIANVARPHAERAGMLTTIPPRDVDNIGPAAALYASAEDLARWLQVLLGRGMLDGKRIIAEKAVDTILTPQMLVGLAGWQKALYPQSHFLTQAMGFMLQDYRGRLVAWGTGGIDGFSCSLALIPEEQLGVAVLTNVPWTGLPEAIVYFVLDDSLGVRGKDWSAVRLELSRKSRQRTAAARKAQEGQQESTTFSIASDKIVGTYTSALLGEAVIEQHDGQLSLRLGKSLRGSLMPWREGVLRVTFADAELGTTLCTLTLGAEGVVTAFTLSDHGKFSRSAK